MSLEIPLTTLGATYSNFGVESGVYTSGYLTLAAANADVILYFGQAAGNSAPVLAPALPPGQYVLTPGQRNMITGVQARAAGGVVGSPAPTLQGQLFQPAEPSIIPVANANATTNISSSMQRIGQQFLSASGGAVTFSGIPTSYTALLLLASAHSDQVSDQSWFAQFNGDTGANYQQQLFYGSASTTNASFSTADNQIQFGTLPQNASSFWGTVRVWLPMYTLGIPQTIMSEFSSFGGTDYDGSVGGTWAGPGPITSIKMFPGAGSFSANSQFTLYGL